MCGISGILSSSISKEDKEISINQMFSVLDHRGPDSSGMYVDENIALGHTRLAIIDIEYGRQPMESSDSSLVVVYNGEIYNFQEIRRELIERGYSFSTRCDTEVVLYAFQEWGKEAFIRFNGMFALALWEKQTGKLYLARDRLGIKPLYFYRDKNDLFFASEIKAFSKISDQKLIFSKEGIAQYLAFQSYHFQQSLFKGVEQIHPGYVYVYQEERLVEKYQFYKLEFAENEHLSFSESTEKLASVIESSVERHLIADVPVSTYLSGGFDSSLVSTISSTTLPQVLTFNGTFREGKQFDESPLAQAVANKINSNHNTVIITSDDFVKEFDRVIYHLDEPLMGPGAFSQFVVAREISKQVKVVLTGHGGDEMFAGYPVYKVALLKKLGLKGYNEFFGGLEWGDALRMAYFLIYPLFSPLLRTGLVSLFSANEIKKLVADKFLLEGIEEYLNTVVSNLMDPHLDSFQQVMFNYITGYLPGLFLVEDKISMAHSLESRTPLCDNEMLALSLQIPAKVKLHKGQLKALLKQYGKNSLPSVLYNQPKRGFPTPVHLWFRGPLRLWVEARLFDSQQCLFNQDALRKIWSRFLMVKGDGLYGYNLGCRIYSILSLLSSHKQHYDLPQSNIGISSSVI